MRLNRGFQGCWVQKWLLFCAQRTPSLCFDLLLVRGKLTSANSRRLNFRKYAPMLVKKHCLNFVLKFWSPKWSPPFAKCWTVPWQFLWRALESMLILLFYWILYFIQIMIWSSLVVIEGCGWSKVTSSIMMRRPSCALLTTHSDREVGKITVPVTVGLMLYWKCSTQ